MATKAKDDLEAVRQVAETLEGFSGEERERILRWVRERLGMASGAAAVAQADATARPSATAAGPVASAQDIRAFVELKKPRSDNQLAAVVAYFHRFVAKGDEKKDVISSTDLQDACRKADVERIKRPAQVLVNAFHDGLLDRAERGTYKLSTVGENLVAMVLPDIGGGKVAPKSKARRAAKKKSGKKARGR